MKINRNFGISSFLFVLSAFLLSGINLPVDNNEIILSPKSGLMTNEICSAIDQCAAKGGGTVRFLKGVFHSGTIVLKPNVTLLLHSGAILRGSDLYTDYRNDAFIYGKDLTNIAIIGKGTIDGVDCVNPKGEEGFRGPHCVRLVNCEGILLKGITIVRSANWALNLRYCKKGTVENVVIRGGHDGLHTRFCEQFSVTNCDFRTGDDCFAGNDNKDFVITGCKVNSSCNGFRFGCLNLVVRNCSIWGPGEYKHKISNRTNMLAAFVHFSPRDENPKLISGNWSIENLKVQNADFFYVYNFKDGLWQTGQPATSVTFNNIEATGLLKAFTVSGLNQENFNLTVKNSTFRAREGKNELPLVFEGAKLVSQSFFSANEFGSICIFKSIFEKQVEGTIAEFESGKMVEIEKSSFLNHSVSKLVSIKKVAKTNFKNE